MGFEGYGFTREFTEEVARRFVGGDTVAEIADDTYNAAEDIEELLRQHIRTTAAALSAARTANMMIEQEGSFHYGEEETEHDCPEELAGM